MLARIKENAKILVPNPQYKNLTEIDEFIPKGSLVHGEFKQIQGLRQGKPFVFKLFRTDNNQLIYKNKIELMNTEVKLGADADVSATNINLKPAEKSHKDKYYGILLGGIAGFAYAKWQKHDMKRVAMWIALGAAAGWGAAYLIDTNKKAIVTPSK